MRQLDQPSPNGWVGEKNSTLYELFNGYSNVNRWVANGWILSFFGVSTERFSYVLFTNGVSQTWRVPDPPHPLSKVIYFFWRLNQPIIYIKLTNILYGQWNVKKKVHFKDMFLSIKFKISQSLTQFAFPVSPQWFSQKVKISKTLPLPPYIRNIARLQNAVQSTSHQLSS